MATALLGGDFGDCDEVDDRAAASKDGSWGVHAPTHTQKKVNEAKLLTDGAKATLAGKGKAIALNQ